MCVHTYAHGHTHTHTHTHTHSHSTKSVHSYRTKGPAKLKSRLSLSLSLSHTHTHTLSQLGLMGWWAEGEACIITWAPSHVSLAHTHPHLLLILYDRTKGRDSRCFLQNRSSASHGLCKRTKYDIYTFAQPGGNNESCILIFNVLQNNRWILRLFPFVCYICSKIGPLLVLEHEKFGRQGKGS